jgi:tyrosine aminotransferase
MNSMEKSLTNGNKDAWLPIQASKSAKNTVNPIRRIVDRLKISPNPAKEMISLSIGDPTHYANMLPPIEALEAIVEAVQLPTSHGYAPSFGNENISLKTFIRYFII